MLKTAKGALQTAMNELKESEAAVQTLTTQNAAQAERAAEVRAEAREAKVALDQAKATLKSVQAQFAAGSASREAVAKAKRAAEVAEKAQLDAEELVTALEGAMKGQPAEIAAAGNRVAAAQRAFRQQLLEHVLREEQPFGVGPWLTRVMALARVTGAATPEAVFHQILKSANTSWAHCPTGDALFASSTAIEQEFLGRGEA